jgi:hypothetical protein
VLVVGQEGCFGKHGLLLSDNDEPAAVPHEVAAALSRGRSGDAAGAIVAMAELANRLSESEAARLVRALGDTAAEFARFYGDFIFAREAAEAQAVLAYAPRAGLGYRDVASHEGAASYDRVADMFRHVDFSNCHHFVLVGAGELPMTALHVHDRTGVAHIDCLDTRHEAVRSVEALAAWLGSDRLRGLRFDGAQYDYSDADVIFVANMVRPKQAVLARILDTAPDHVRIVLRDPYSLGLLWAEEGGAALDACVSIVTRGAGSRFLSRNLFLARRASA